MDAGGIAPSVSSKPIETSGGLCDKKQMTDAAANIKGLQSGAEGWWPHSLLDSQEHFVQQFSFIISFHFLCFI